MGRWGGLMVLGLGGAEKEGFQMRWADRLKVNAKKVQRGVRGKKSFRREENWAVID